MLSEALITNKYKEKNGVVWTYSRGNFPNAVFFYEGNQYSFVLLKSNKSLRAYHYDDKQATFAEISAYARQNKILKKSFSGLTADKFYTNLVVTQGMTPGVVKMLFPRLDGMKLGSDPENMMKVGDFEILFTKPAEGKHLGAIMGEACKLLSKHKYDKLCYGKVMTATKMRGRAVAHYHVSEDYIAVSNKARKSDEVLLVVIHELGHRFYRKHLDLSARKLIISKWNEMLNTRYEVSVGDVFKDEKGNRVEIVDVRLMRSGVFYVFTRNDKKYRAPADTFSAWQFIDGNKKKNKTLHPFQVSNYAKTDHEEFFCEVFAHAIVHNRKDLLDWVKQFKLK